MGPPVQLTISLYPQPDTRMAVRITNNGWPVDTHFYHRNRDDTYGPDHLSPELPAQVIAQRYVGSGELRPSGSSSRTSTSLSSVCCVMSVGDGYEYLLRTVVDADRSISTPRRRATARRRERRPQVRVARDSAAPRPVTACSGRTPLPRAAVC